jgi:uncharacterized protein
MIVQLEVENFYSILDRQVIDLRVTDKVPDEPHRFGNVHPRSADRIPKVVALFGANASGKTCVLRALAFVTWFVRDSFQLPPEQGMPFEYFRSKNAMAKPTRIAVTFGEHTRLESGDEADESYGIYQYEVILEHRIGLPSVVGREVLTYRPFNARKSHTVFERNSDGQVSGGRLFQSVGQGPVPKKIRWNTSIISTLAQFEHPQATALRNLAMTVQTNVLVWKQDITDAQLVEQFDRRSDLLESVNRQIRRIDLGALQMKVHRQPGGRYLEFLHEGLDSPIPWILESHGTKSFITSFPLIWAALQQGGVAIIDELDAALHPHMLKEIASWFYDPEYNPRDAQLWCSCQNASFLEELRKEEIYFCEKDSAGRTNVYGLQDMKNVRRLDNHYRKYLSGTYGAVPNIG